jgi:hypothetical protein
MKAVLNINQGWPPEGCEALPVTMRLLKLMWRIHQEFRPKLIELINRYNNDTQIFHLKSPPEMSTFTRIFEMSDRRAI